MPKKDLTGQRFGRLVVLEEAGRKNGSVTWLCRCDCDNEKIIRGDGLVGGLTKSCGCLRLERVRQAQVTHDQTRTRNKTPTYQSWDAMISRCHNANNNRYHYYGGRGIKVCDRWRYSFENFYEDMGDKPEGKTLDRIDNNGHYTPENCKWSTQTEQTRNSRAKGYYWRKKEQKWVVSITVNYKKINLGYFDTEEEARQVYLEAKEKYHGIKLNGKY